MQLTYKTAGPRGMLLRNFVSTALLAAIWLGAKAAEQSADDAFLNRLQGQWTMQGTIQGQPARYRAVGERTLNNGFLKLHLLDVGKPPKYQADVYIGFDPTAHDFVVHWLDQFGAAGARVVATGARTGDQLVVTFPYAEGAFRDTLTWVPATRSWRLVLESQSKPGTWSTFASYELTRAQ